MSLTSGRGPLRSDRAGIFSPPVAGQLVYVEPFQRRVRAVRQGDTVVDSERVVLVHRPGAAPSYAFPAGDVSGVESTPVPEAPAFVTVTWDAVDAWWEEDQEVFLHPRNPYHRIDIVPTHRRLRVLLGDTVLVDTTETLLLYETSLAPKLYVHPRHVTPGILSPSETTTYCPYKGTTTYWHATLSGVRADDVAWSYEEPLPESTAIRGLLSFEESRVRIETDIPPPVDLGTPDATT